MTQVLFIEDDQDDVFLIERACKTAGVGSARFIADGYAAQQDLSNHFSHPKPHSPKLIFLDLNMPRMGGFAFLEWFRQQAEGQLIPVIILSTSENPEDIHRAYRLGANAYLVKPSSIGQLSQMLAAAHHFWLTYNRLE